MMKGFEHTGFWWDPRDPETRWPGTLRFDPVAGATLSRTIPFHPRQLLGKSQEFEILHGETTGTLKITLLHCFERSSTDVYANAVITGFHADQPDPPVLAAAAVIENLNEWWGQRAITRDTTLKHPDVGVRYVQPGATVVHEDSLLRTSIGSGASSSFEGTRASIEEEIRIELKASEPQPLSVFRQRIHGCQDLLSIASLTLCNVEDLRILQPSDEPGAAQDIGHFYAVPVFKNPAEDWPDFLFTQKNVAARLHEVFGAWLGNAQSLSVVRSLYMSGAYGKSFLELRFLSLAQAAEAYHRRLYEGQDLYVDARTYEQNILPGLLGAIPETLDPSHAQALRSRLKYGNEFSFRKRLTMLFDEHQAALAAVIPSPREWIERIVAYRNDLTHHPIVENRPDVDKIALVQCNYVLRILLELCFLKSMAIDADAIRQLAAECPKYRQISQRFFEAKS